MLECIPYRIHPIWSLCIKHLLKFEHVTGRLLGWVQYANPLRWLLYELQCVWEKELQIDGVFNARLGYP